MAFVISFVVSTFILLAITFSESIYLVLAFAFGFAVISQLSFGSVFHYKFRNDNLIYKACAYISITLSYVAWFCVLAHGFRTLHIALCALAAMSWLVTIFIGRK